MREIVYTGQYKRDLKRARKRQMQEDDLNEVIRLLAEDQPLPPRKERPRTYRQVFRTARMPYTPRLAVDIWQRRLLHNRGRRCNKGTAHTKPRTYGHACRLVLTALLMK